jgi:hypothetical protein
VVAARVERRVALYLWQSERVHLHARRGQIRQVGKTAAWPRETEPNGGFAAQEGLNSPPARVPRVLPTSGARSRVRRLPPPLCELCSAVSRARPVSRRLRLWSGAGSTASSGNRICLKPYLRDQFLHTGLTLVSCKLTRTHNTAIPYNLAQEPAARAPRRILGVRRACVAASCIDAGPVRCSRSLLHTAVVAGEPGDAPGRRPFVPIDEAPRNPQRSSQVKVSSHRRAARSGSVRPHPRPRTGTIADSSAKARHGRQTRSL